MNRRLLSAALWACLALPAMAAALDLPSALAGVYKHRFSNGLVTGESYKSEDILEIVPVAPDAAYFRLHSEFYNGHVCDISGVARAQAEALIYQGPKDVNGAPCRLTLERGRDGLHIHEDENGACRAMTCGARGGYGFNSHGAPDFTFAERRSIRYLPRLLGSSEYKEAMAAFQAGGASGKR